MANYRWTDNRTLTFPARYFGVPIADLVGAAEWEALMTSLRFFNSPADAWPFLQRIRRARLTHPPRRCPRLFVSHRQGKVDEALALRIAWCASKEHFEYWIDVLDLPPSLTQGAQQAPAFVQAILIGATIEMALINCSAFSSLL